MEGFVASRALAREAVHAYACLHVACEARARQCPDAIALRFRDASLTYGELERRANQLAHALVRAGVGPDVLVGHFVERSLDAVVALLAILKAGGAYLPLDPDNPGARTRLVLDDAKPRLVVTQSSLRDRVDGACICIDRFDFTGDDGAPPLTATPDHLAYVIYTSGSTGQPKGTLVTHANVDRLFRTTEAWFGFGASDVWTVFHSFAFDFSVWELWGALRYGGCAVLVPGDVARATAAFRALLDDERVTILCQTPSAFNALIDIERIAPLRERSLRYVIFGGEALEFRRLAPWYARHGREVQLVNMYGITETTVHTTYFPVAPDRLDQGSVIGVPLPDLRIHLLDDKLEPVARGETGEIYVGGPGVARGYLNRPELTAKRFVRDPSGSGETLYRSGDLGRLRADGNLDFCGRIDDQVKLRGYRIELGEIEHALDRCAGVVRSAVVLRATERGDKELVAYTIGDQARSKPAALRDALAATLPSYMVPSAFVPLSAFPLTTNGKLDKAALPAPRREHRPAASEDAPRGDTEQRVAAIWARALAADRIGRLDDFFALGAHSLMIAAVCVKLEDEFEIALTAMDLYAARDVARLAETIDAKRRRGARSENLAPVPRASERDLPTAFGQDMALYFHELAPGNLAYNNQVLVRLHGPLDAHVLERALSEIVRRHESLRTTFERVDATWRQVVHAPSPVALDVVDGNDDDVRDLFAHRFNPRRLPLVRWTLMRHSPIEHTLAHVEHHLIHDGWSFGVFARELMALYDAFARGLASPLPALPIQFADFALWQRARQAAGLLDASHAYWQRTLAGASGVLDLATDRPRPALQTFLGEEVQVDLSPALSRALRAYARARRSSLFAVMLAGFAATLHRFARQDDVVVGSGYASRDHRSLAQLIGMIVNMVPLRIRFANGTTFADAVAHAGTVAHQAVPHQHVPFDAIVRGLGLRHDASRNPLCQVAFSFHDSAMPPWRMGEVTGEVHYPHNGSAKFDMNVIVVPHAEQHVDAGARDERITLKWDFNTALFERTTIERMVQGYLQLLEGGVAVPAAPVADLLDAQEAGGYRAVREMPVVEAPAGKQPPRTETERMVAQVWARHFDCDGVGIHDDFFDSGGHSLAAASVFAELSTRTGAELPLSLLFEARTIASLAHAIDERRSEARSALLIPVQRLGNKSPIFAMLGIGANFVGYAALAEAFGSDQPLYSLEMPGLDGDALPDACIEDVVERLRKVVADVPGSERCVLLGACAGALVVYELARALVATGREVAHVIMLDPPPTGGRRPAATPAALRRRLALPRFLAGRVSLAMRTFGSLSGEERIAFLRAKARVVRDIVERRDLLRESRQEYQFSRVREATNAAITQFAPRPYAGRVTLLVGERYSLEGADDVSSDWRTLCCGDFDVARVPGRDTGAMLRSPNLERISERLRTLVGD